MLKSNHCLHELLSCFVQRSDSLRSRGHDYVLPAVSAIYTNSLLSLGHSLILFSTVMMSLRHPAVFMCVCHIYFLKYCVTACVVTVNHRRVEADYNYYPLNCGEIKP